MISKFKIKMNNNLMMLLWFILGYVYMFDIKMNNRLLLGFISGCVYTFGVLDYKYNYGSKTVYGYLIKNIISDNNPYIIFFVSYLSSLTSLKIARNGTDIDVKNELKQMLTEITFGCKIYTILYILSNYIIKN